MYTQKSLEEMTHEELLNHARKLEASEKNVVVSIGREDLAHVFSGILQVSEEKVASELLDVAQQAMRGKFGFDDETEQISNFLTALPIDWESLHQTTSGLEVFNEEQDVYLVVEDSTVGIIRTFSHLATVATVMPIDTQLIAPKSGMVEGLKTSTTSENLPEVK